MNANNRYKLKVCGMKFSANIRELIKLNPDFIGFIFYKASKRFVPQVDQTIDYKNTQKVGVFVNESIDLIIEYHRKYKLDYVQLHGEEDQEYCKFLSSKGIVIIKAFRIDHNFEFEQCNLYTPHVKYFLFDAKGKFPGGNGISYDWGLLDHYKEKIPFLLSGGIDNKGINKLKNFNHPFCVGIDINSGFELEPGLKDVIKIEQFKAKL